MNFILNLIISFIALLWAANHLVTGASRLALRLQLSPLIIGITIVAMGTSAPELFVSIISALKDKTDLAVGNAIGSSIANIGLILGITIFIKPTSLAHNKLKEAYPILVIIMLFVYSLILDGYLGKIDGCFFLLGCIAVICYLIYLVNQSHKKDLLVNQFRSAVLSYRSTPANLFSIGLGLLIIPISSKYIVYNASEIALWAGLSELTIGLTIIAIGTSLPELSTALVAAIKGEETLAIGTILGSNIYNLLLILAFPGLLNPTKISSVVLWRDMPAMILITFLLFLSHYQKKSSSWLGGVLLLVYFSYLVSLIIKTHGSP
ncbi:sodium:calcium antiporter [Legionella norrlandica]|uniref:Sodium:calcium antiporter n=1 Tax=Legionella norrlandica TaxID=1498499 RepID=A0A0A2SWM7_9GAMM|nr:calcium/sodium antiporter [Legionella norrlandica]KGP64136.1 sodium:calcium antiporter [Legionella norrlandica]